MSVPPPPGATGRWHRLHPLSPLVRAGRGALGILVALALSSVSARRGDHEVYALGAIGVALVAGLISWLVTRWRLEPGNMRIERGWLRRSSLRFPLDQVQAVDIVRPGLARLFGLSELRLRMAGGAASTARLAYLTEAEAEALRTWLLAGAAGSPSPTPAAAPAAPPERRLLTVPTGQLVASMLLTGPALVVALLLAALVALAAFDAPAAGGVIGASAASLVALAGRLWYRFNGEYRMTLSETSGGLRLRAGLVETSAETIPRGRVQALRMVEPWLWRPLGWCRLEVDVAGRPPSGHQDRSARRTARALLPVGTRAQAAWLVDRLAPGVPAPGERPPPRARWKSPLRFPRLSWAFNDGYAVTTSGRVRRVTDWVPLSKVQSVRRVQGPVQRRLALVDIHLDTAGRSVHSVVRDADRGSGDVLVVSLPERCRVARAADRPPSPAPRR